MSQKLRVQNALVDLLLNRPFPVVTYNAQGKPSLSGQTVVPITPILSNEIASAFVEDDDMGREVMSLRSGWIFEVRAEFPREVLLEHFEEEMMSSPPRIGPDPQNGYPYVQLRLNQTQPSHPVQKGSATGTKVQFFFQAVQGRR
jgi:hypothetical protein